MSAEQKFENLSIYEITKPETILSKHKTGIVMDPNLHESLVTFEGGWYLTPKHIFVKK